MDEEAICMPTALAGEGKIVKMEPAKFRAGHFRYFLIFSLIKNDFFSVFIKLI